MHDEETAPKEARGTPAVSGSLDGALDFELLYDAAAQSTAFAVWRDQAWTIEQRIHGAHGESFVPFSPNNNLIKNHAVLLPSEPCEYRSEEELRSGIEHFLHRYVDLSPTFEKLATHYVLLTWLYDVFNELPYLRLRGDYGTGKTRALLTIGSVCYKPFFASGASTVSPIFHTLDAFQGTLIFDEADFRFSDERAEIVKILNNGNVRGLPVLRTMMNRQREFNPQAFKVFGPKIVATRGRYEDKALESRFITEEMGGRPLRDDIPINLPPAFNAEALALRNKLLLFRFRKRGTVRLNEELVDRRLEPRLNQILLPLLSIVADRELREELLSIAGDTQAMLVAERGTSAEGHIVEILGSLVEDSERASIPISEIVVQMTERFGNEYDRPITNRWIGGILRGRLNLQTYKSHGVYVVPMSERTKLRHLCTRYGVTGNEGLTDELQSGDVGTSGT
jgi:hypothetical protein